MGSPPQHAAELGLEQPAAGRLEDVGPPAEVDGGSTAKMEGDHVAFLKEECRPGGTWAERPHESYLEGGRQSILKHT
jgi:hypothetical protein